MILTVASFKGGVGKTTTAVHLAAYLNNLSRAVLLDGDATKNATAWSRGRAGFPFPVAPIEAAAKLAREYEHTVIDTGQMPSIDDLQAAVKYSDLLVIPTVPAQLDTDSLAQTLKALKEIPGAKYKVLLVRVSIDMAREAAELRKLLESFGAPVFNTEIPRLKAFDKAATDGAIVSAAVDRNGARAWEAYEAVGKELGL